MPNSKRGTPAQENQPTPESPPPASVEKQSTVSKRNISAQSKSEQEPYTLSSDYPALKAHLKKLGATEISFRSAVIYERSETDNYKRESKYLRWDREGNVRSSDKALLPDEATQKAIKDEIAKNPLPTTIPATEACLENLCKKLCISKDDPALYVFRDKKKVLFVQHKKGDDYIPYSFTSFGWMMVEPDDGLPLFGLEQLDKYHGVIVHEGAKGGRHWQRCNDPGLTEEERAEYHNHPWHPQLKDCAHLGWAGGAPNPHKTNWKALKDLPPHVPITIVADNDAVGQSAVTKISRLLNRSLNVLLFDDRFEESFDLADKFPAKLYERGKYHGPTFDECCFPATWATKQIETADKRYKAFALTKDFLDEWMYCHESMIAVNLKHADRLLNFDSFNAFNRPFSDVAKLSEILIKNVEARADQPTYIPGQPAGLVNVGGKRFVNTYRRSSIRSVKGNPKPFVDFMVHLIPDEKDRIILQRWLATLIAEDKKHMKFGMILISETQGVGKTTLMEKIALPLVGAHNCSTPTEQQMTGNYNFWLAHKRLILVNEFYAGEGGKAIYNKLKSYVTDGRVRVEEKYTKAYDIDNWAHYILASNNPRPLHMAIEDRRWFIPTVTEQTKKPAEWTKLNSWLRDDGLGIIRHWIDDFLKANHPISDGEHAPPSAAKDRLIALSLSPGQERMLSLGNAILERAAKNKVEKQPSRYVLIDKELELWNKDKDGGRGITEKRSTLLRSFPPGFTISKKQFNGGGFRDVYVISNDPGIATVQTWEEIREDYERTKKLGLDRLAGDVL